MNYAVGVRQGAVLAPQQSVTHNQKGEPNALVVGADNTVELRALQTDRAVGDQWLVTSGLKAGEKVIVEGIQKVKSGMPVAAKPWTPPAERSAAPAVETEPAEHPET